MTGGRRPARDRRCVRSPAGRTRLSGAGELPGGNRRTGARRRPRASRPGRRRGRGRRRRSGLAAAKPAHRLPAPFGPAVHPPIRQISPVPAGSGMAACQDNVSRVSSVSVGPARSTGPACSSITSACRPSSRSVIRSLPKYGPTSLVHSTLGCGTRATTPSTTRVQRSANRLQAAAERQLHRPAGPGCAAASRSAGRRRSGRRRRTPDGRCRRGGRRRTARRRWPGAVPAIRGVVAAADVADQRRKPFEGFPERRPVLEIGCPADLLGEAGDSATPVAVSRATRSRPRCRGTPAAAARAARCRSAGGRSRR